MNHSITSPNKLLGALVLGALVLSGLSQTASARPPSAVTKAQSTATIFVTVLPGVSPVSYVLGDKICTARSHYGTVGDTVILPAAAKNISLTKGAIITTSVPSADGGEAIKKDYTITRDITVEALTSKAIREIGPYIVPGSVKFDSKAKSDTAQAQDEVQLVSPKYSIAPKCEDIYATVKRFVKDHPEKVLEVVAFHVGQHETCACEIVKAAIIASDADVALVVEIVETAIEVAPGKFRIIGQCAIAVAPDALAEVQTITSKYGAVSANSGAPRGDMTGMVHIPAGQYPGPNGVPYKTRGFWLDAHEVTIGEYADFLQAITKLSDNGKTSYQHEGQPLAKISHDPDDWENLYAAAKQQGRWNKKKVDLNYPVVGVDWWDAYAYARWRGRQLPSHEQWYAAYSYGSDPAKLAAKPASKSLKSVNLSERTSHGVHGMAGNVSEWVGKKTINPADPSEPQRHMISGASYLRPESGAGAREWVQSRSLRRADLGFRTYSDGRGQFAHWGEKWSEKGDDKGGKGGAGGDLGRPFQQPQVRPMSMDAINALANAVDRLSETTVNPFNVLDDIVTDSNVRRVGSTDVLLPNPVRKRRVIVGGSTYDHYGSLDALAMANRMAAINRQADSGQNEGGRGWDTEKGGAGWGEKGNDDYSDDVNAQDDPQYKDRTGSIIASVVGEVENPGKIRLPSSGKIDILTAIVMAGGYAEEANQNECILHRHDTPIREAMRINLRDIRNAKKPMIFLYEGDMVTIKKLQF